ncbi:MAG: hypothetical protein II639_05250 [Clostridia bacterium]|nr:hypothetical protein [Clostridia bacterium]
MKNDMITEKQDLRHLTWSKVRNSSGTAGSFLKAYSDLGGHKTYYKLSNYDSVHGITGHECVNELIVDRLLTVLGVEHLHYQLLHADILLDDRPTETWLCSSGDFKQPGETKIALDAYYQAERMVGESPLDFCIRNGWASYVYEMLVVDYLILNRDRHGANMEVLRNGKTRTVRLAPLFDHGLSLLFSCRSSGDIRAADIMEDKPVQSFVGSHSARENLELIPPGKEPNFRPLQPSDREVLLAGLDAVLPEEWLEKIWQMIWNRWCEYEDFRDSRR